MTQEQKLTVDQLKTVRKAYGLSQEQLAAKIGVSSAAISMVECGRRSLSDTISARTVEAFGLTTSKLAEVIETYEQIRDMRAQLISG